METISAKSSVEPVSAAQAEWFQSTHWSVVLDAGLPGSPQASAALSKLCQTYWYPLYLYVRRLGHSPEDSQDLTQEFFTRLIEKNFLATADKDRGTFRSFLLTMLKRFLHNEWDRANRQKRGGGREIISLDNNEAETRFIAEPASAANPEKEFEKRWAMNVLEQVLQRLETEYAGSGKGHLFAELKIFLTGDKSELSYAEIARKLQMSEGTLKVTVHRLRQRYGQLLRMEIGNTVSTTAEIDGEIRHLFSALS